MMADNTHSTHGNEMDGFLNFVINYFGIKNTYRL